MKLYFYLKRAHEVEKFIRKLVGVIRHSALKVTTSEKPGGDLIKSDIWRSKAFESPGTDPSSAHQKMRVVAALVKFVYVYKHTVMRMRVTRVYSDVKRCPAIKMNKFNLILVLNLIRNLIESWLRI